MTTLAHRTELGRPAKRRSRRPARARPLVGASASPRVAAAAPRADAPHRRCRCRDRQHHDRVQRSSCRRRRVRLGESTCSISTAPIHASSMQGSSPPGSRSERSTSSATARCGCPAPSRRSITGHRIPMAPMARDLLALRRGTYPVGRRSGRRHRRSCGVSAARDRVDPGARRAPPDGRGHRREPGQAERRVRPRRSLVREPDRVTVLVDATPASLDSFYSALG